MRLLKSIDGGKTFKNVKGPHHVDHHDLWIDPKNPGRMIDSNDGGVDITTNGGETWHCPLPIASSITSASTPACPTASWATCRTRAPRPGRATACPPPASRSATGTPSAAARPASAVADPTDPNIVYAGEYAGILTRYDHRTRQARNISIYPTNPLGPGRRGAALPLPVDRADPDLAARSQDDLSRRQRPLPHHGRRPHLGEDQPRPDPRRQDEAAVVRRPDHRRQHRRRVSTARSSPSPSRPKQAGVLWAGSDDGLVHVSHDGGKSWSNVTKNIPGLPEWGTVCCIEASRHDAGTAYVVVDAHRLDDDRPYLWKTNDFGKTWTQLSGAAAAGRLPARRPRGSRRARHALRRQRARRVVLARRRRDLGEAQAQPADRRRQRPGVKDNDLVVGTNGRSIWILDDLTPLRQWSPKLEEKPHLFPSPPAMRWRYHGENYAGEDRIAGDNPPKGAIINYYLPAKPKEELTLEILDAKGDLVRKLTSKKAGAGGRARSTRTRRGRSTSRRCCPRSRASTRRLGPERRGADDHSQAKNDCGRAAPGLRRAAGDVHADARRSRQGDFTREGGGAARPALKASGGAGSDAGEP